MAYLFSGGKKKKGLMRGGKNDFSISAEKRDGAHGEGKAVVS